MAAPLTASSSIEDWLADPNGGPILTGLLQQGGISAEVLAPV
jgi:hypothetical protein